MNDLQYFQSMEILVCHFPPNSSLSQVKVKHQISLSQMQLIKPEQLLCLLWPALECGNGEQSQNSIEHVVKVKVIVEPFSLSHYCVLQGILHMLQVESPESRYKEH